MCKSVDGLDKESMKLCEMRRQARTHMLVNPTDEDQRSCYKSLSKDVKKAVKKAKIDIFKEKTKQIETDYRENRTHKLFKNIKDLEGKPRKPLMAVKDATENKTTNISEMLSIWQTF